MAYGFFHNVFETISSAFSKTGQPFQNAFKFARLYITDRPQAETFIRRLRENRLFKRAEPFVAELPKNLKPTEALFTPTTLMLKEKNQYLFRVKFRYTDRPLTEFEFMSFTSNDVLTKAEAEKRMGEILLQKRNAEVYTNLQSIEMDLRGTRTSLWLP